MSDNEFNLVLLGEGARYTFDGSTRLRYIVSEAASKYAHELRAAGKVERSARMVWISSQLRSYSRPISKGVMRRARADIDELSRRVVDGESVSGL